MRRRYQQLSNALAKDIRAGKYKTGSRLPAERDLARRFGVSRPTIREAIIALEILGLVEARIGSGVYVTDSAKSSGGAAELDIGPFELMEARRLLECETAALAAATANDEQIERLQNIVEEMQDENRRGVAGEWADRKFHVAIAEATHNGALVAMIEHLWDIRTTSPMCATMLDKARAQGVQPTISDHQKILDAIKRRDKAAARLTMHGHLTRVIEGLLIATETDALEQVRQDSESLRRRYAASD